MQRKVLMGSIIGSLLICNLACAETEKKNIATDGSNTIESPYFKVQYPPNAKSDEPHVELHMDERYMWGTGAVEARGLYGSPLGVKTTMYSSTLRTRFWLQGTVDKNLKVTAMLKDERSLRKDGDDTPAYFERVYANYNKGNLSSTAGRFYYWIDDGNVFEDVMDGAMVKYGTDKTYGSLTYGRTRDYYAGIENTYNTGKSGAMQGYILRGRHRIGPVEEELAYYNFKKNGGYVTPFNQQKIFSARTRYYLGNASSIGWEYLNSKGEGYGLGENNGHGTVWSLNFGDEWANPSVKNSYCIHLRHYDQPRSSFIKHTMSGYPNMLSTADPMYGSLRGFDGFKGWGLYSEYIVMPGIQLSLEAYNLKGRGNSEYAGSATEKIIGASVNFYF